MGDQDDGAVEVGQVAAELGADLQAGVGVQRGQRLVQQQQARSHGQGAGQGDALGLAAGQLPGPGVGVLGEADALQPDGRAAARVGFGGAVAARAEGDVVQRGQVREEQVLLEDHADRAALGGDRVQRPVVQVDVAGRQGGEPGQGAQRGGLARAVGAEQGDDLARGDGEVDVQAEAGAFDDEVGAQGHGLFTHRSRRLARMITETASRTRLSTIAASGSVSRAM